MDISILFKIAAIGIIVTVICQILKKSDRDDVATVVSIVGCNRAYRSGKHDRRFIRRNQTDF